MVLPLRRNFHETWELRVWSLFTSSFIVHDFENIVFGDCLTQLAWVYVQPSRYQLFYIMDAQVKLNCKIKIAFVKDFEVQYFNCRIASGDLNIF